MKLRLVCSLTVTIASLFGYAAEMRFEYGSLEFELASTFSRVEPVGKDRLGVVILDRLAGFSMSNLSTRVSRRLKANERLELLSGETVRFKQVRDACGWLDLTLGTNSLAFMGDVPQERVRTDGLFICVDAHANGSPATGMASRERRYLIDVAGGWYYDVESRTFRQIVFPFSAPWKDWVDYAENYAQRAKVDWLGFCQRLGKGLYEKAVGDEDVPVSEVCRHGLRSFGVVMSGVFDDRERRQEVSEQIVHVEFRRRLPGTVSRPVNAVEDDS